MQITQATSFDMLLSNKKNAVLKAAQCYLNEHLHTSIAQFSSQIDEVERLILNQKKLLAQLEKQRELALELRDQIESELKLWG